MRSFRILFVLVAFAISIGCQPKSPSAPGDKKAASENTKAEKPAADHGDAGPSPKESPAANENESGETSIESADDAPDESTSDESAPDESASDESESEGGAAAIDASTGAIPDEHETVMLGTAELVSGIPGEGPLTIEEITAWIDDPKNHRVIDPELPLGLAKGAGQMKIPEDNPLTRAKIELGRQLYFDTRLSADSTVSCATCHDPSHAFAAESQFGVGVQDQTGDRNSPVAFNRILSDKQFWDGRAESLEAQAIGPVANPIEMGNTHEACEKCVNGIEGYRVQFEKIFPGEGVTIDNIGKAIASFERALVTGPSPYDYYEPLAAFENAYADYLEDLDAFKEDDPETYEEYLALKEAADAHPMNESAIRGAKLFFDDRAGCTACHVGANFTDEKYHNLGVGMDSDNPPAGRFGQTNDPKDTGAQKTPTLRNVAQSGPYMHDGSQKTLEEVVAWYNKGGHPNEHLSKDIKKLDLSDQEQADLVAFMEALTGPLPHVERERLPE